MNPSDLKLRECREAFEAWVISTGYDSHHHGSFSLEIAWSAWQASSRHTDKLLEMAAESLKTCRTHAANAWDSHGDEQRYDEDKVSETLLNLQQHLGKD